MNTERLCQHCSKPLDAKTVHGLCPECFLKVGLGSEPGGARRPNGFLPPEPEELTPHFPQLEIIELLGKGGMGAVYKARQKGLDRLVALKVLPPDAGRDPAFAERFTREARALAQLNHPGIVAVHDFGVVQGGTSTGAGLYFFIMEFVDGLNLRQMLRANRLSPREAMAIVPQICEALQYAHDQGIVHRDIKPENVLVDKAGRVKIADFGLAKLLGNDSQGEPLTRSAEVMGTPQYMAPEQLEKPLEVDHRADIYSLGVVFYEMLTGELPLGRFRAPSHKVQLDVRLDEIVLRALEKEPELRYQQASVFKTEVETVAADPFTRRRQESEGLTPPPAPNLPAGPRMSRLAIAGAAWAVFFLMLALGLIFANYTPGQSPHGSASPGAIFLLFVVLPLGIAAPFGTTVLGWLALSEIRRAAGRIQGLTLALFDGLLFPLLLLDFMIAGAWLAAARLVADKFLNIGDSLFFSVWDGLIWLLLMFGTMAWADFLVIRRAARGANGIQQQTPGTAVTGGLTLSIVAFPIVIILALFAAKLNDEARQKALLRSHPAEAASSSGPVVDRDDSNSNVADGLWVPTFLPGEEANPGKVLDEAAELSRKGHYEEALQRHIWYHNHALELDPNLNAVRLSFGLSSWGELGRRYPKAKQALVKIRDAHVASFAQGQGYFDRFMEVASINRELQQEDETVTLFRAIRSSDPKLAAQCYGVAEDALLQRGEYDLCRSFIGNPQTSFESIRNSWKREKQFHESATAPQDFFGEFADENFVEQSCKLIEILVATGGKADAERIRDQAVAELADPRLKSAILDAERRIQARAN